MQNGNGNNDPAPHALDIHVHDLTAIVERISAETLDDARRVRDGIDEVMRAFSMRVEQVRGEIEALDTLSHNVIDIVKVMTEAAASLTAEVKVQTPKRMEAPPDMPAISGPLSSDKPRVFGRKGADK